MGLHYSITNETRTEDVIIGGRRFLRALELLLEGDYRIAEPDFDPDGEIPTYPGTLILSEVRAAISKLASDSISVDANRLDYDIEDIRASLKLLHDYVQSYPQDLYSITAYP